MGYYAPRTMQAHAQWVLWKLENGKKKPYSAKYNGLASSTNARTWATYQQVITKLKYGDYNGVGFVFSVDDDFIFIDLDNCITETGEVSEFAQSVIGLFPNTYIEYSQSENGLHIVARGHIPRSYKSGQIEIYSSGRYMAFTGNAYTAEEPKKAQTAINELYRRLNIDSTAPQEETPPTATAPTVADEEIINRATRGANGKQFSALWAGDQNGYKSQSEADLRLISILYYYSGNAEQVERLFLLSGLGQRKKAQTGEYIKRTIQTAARYTKPRSGQNRGLTARNGVTDTPPTRNIKRY